MASPVTLSPDEIAFVRGLVIYEDDAVLALNKPAGLSSQGGRAQVHTLDELLWASDFNCVRGEDSLVRALWAGQPFVWHIYPQHDGAHHAKLHAFLDWLQAPAPVRQFHCAWNGLAPAHTLPVLTAPLLAQWRDCVQAARTRLLAQDDLATQLLGFIAEKARITGSAPTATTNHTP